ncbi:MAG: hypothetical protein IJC92_02390 [Bacteroidaceae bacterium]|nr:hypothetical protein [Bacteroidaceae bacterium]
MQSDIQQRLISFIEYKNLSKNAFESKCGLSKRYVSNLKGVPGRLVIKKISVGFPELNISWLLSGDGEMIKTEKTNMDSEEPVFVDAEAIDIENARAPILPTIIANRSDIDILDYIHKNANDVERSRLIVLDTPIDLWHMVRDESLMPAFRIGDKVALLAYPKGEEKIIPGKLYAIDTCCNGLILRKLYPHENGYIARSFNEVAYPEFHIADSDIIRIYRVVFMGRSIV